MVLAVTVGAQVAGVADVPSPLHVLSEMETLQALWLGKKSVARRALVLATKSFEKLRYAPPELKDRTPAHATQLGWCVEFGSRVTQGPRDPVGQTGRCVAQTSNLGHQLLLPPAN